MTDSLLKWIRPEIRALSAYHVADADGMMKLDAMENPYHLEDGTREVLAAHLSGVELNRYPDPSARSLRSIIKRQAQPPAGTSMLFGNGSDEIIQMLALAVAGEGRSILSLEPGFVMYRMIAEFVGMDYVGVPLRENFDIDLMETLNQINEHQPAIIFIAYPNNPTANCFHRQNIDEIIKAAPGIVVVDEAYHPFAQDSYLEKLTEYDNLLVMRTVSKMGLAGIRLGVLFGHPLLIGEIDKVRLPYNINVLTQAVAEAVLKDTAELDAQAASIRDQRSVLSKAMQGIEGITTFPSQANFILFRVESGSADVVFESIRERGVLIKNMKASEGLLANCLRVTVGTEAENQAFLSALRDSLA